MPKAQEEKNPFDMWSAFRQYAMMQLYFRPKLYHKYQAKITGKPEKIPTKPLVIVANHFSYDDPPFIVLAMQKPVAFLAKQELFEDPQMGKWMRFLSAIPVNREKPGPSTMRQVKQAISKNWHVGVFIEGTRNESREEMTRLQPGAAFIARFGGGLPALPVGIRGGEKRGGILEAHFGDIIPFDASKSLREMTIIYGEAIAKLADMKLNLEKSDAHPMKEEQ
jgi:1-acyl-sn-glycerol-3-phosphate acyltransferase